MAVLRDVLDLLPEELCVHLQEPAPLLCVCRLPPAARVARLRRAVAWQRERHLSLVRAVERGMRLLDAGSGGRFPISALGVLRRALRGPDAPPLPFPGDFASEDEMLAFALSRAPR